MKTFVAILWLALSLSANAQLVLGIIKTGTKIVVFGEPNRPTQIFVDEVPQGTILPSGSWSHDFARRVHDGGGWVTISARVCEETQAVLIVAWPPFWAADRNIAGPSALTDAYIRVPHKRDELQKQIDAIKKAIAGYPGEKPRRKEIDAWLKQVNGKGVSVAGATCTNPSSVQGFRVWTGGSDYGGYGYGDRRTIALYVQGSPDTGYRFRVNEAYRTVR